MKKNQLVAIVTSSVLALASFGVHAFYGTGISNTVNAQGEYCEATFSQLGANHVIFSNEPTKIRIVKNRNHIIATCKYIDESGVSAPRAESLSAAPCSIRDDDGTVYRGEGRTTAANNVVGGGEPCGPGQCLWGNVTTHCKASVNGN